jgi:hypothetical protein
MKLHSEAIIAPENHGSAKVLEKNNFIKEAHLKENEFYEGRFLDTVIYSRLKQITALIFKFYIPFGLQIFAILFYICI